MAEKEGIPAWKRELELKAFRAREKYMEKKAKELTPAYTARMNELLSLYFDGFSEDPEENKAVYNSLNKEWKNYCNKMNRTQKVVTLRPHAFEEEVKIIVAANPRFQPKSTLDKFFNDENQNQTT